MGELSLGPLEWAIVGNGALLLLLFVVLLHMICRLRTLSNKGRHGDLEHGSEGTLFSPNAPHQPFSAFVALPPPHKDDSSLPMPSQPYWIPVHYPTLSMPPRRGGGRCHSCRHSSFTHHPQHFSSTLPKKKLNVDFAN